MQTLLIATHNQGKLREYQSLLADLPLSVINLDEAGVAFDVEETGSTFVENAVLKAQSYAQATGLLTWADDSGLEVDALGGRPGVYSARYGGPGLSDFDRYQRLLAELARLPNAPRTARFHCVVALARPSGQIVTADGTIEGEIVDQPQGSHGFGYDPVFFVTAEGVTMAELPPAVKNRISHRAQAAHAAKQLLHGLLDG